MPSRQDLCSLRGYRDDTLFSLDDTRFLQELRSASFSERMIDGLAFNSRQKLRLFKKGFVTFAYCFKTFFEDPERLFKANVLFSPSDAVFDDPAVFLTLSRELLRFSDRISLESRASRRDRLLANSLTSDEESPRFLKIPEEFSLHHLFYLSSLHLGPSIFVPSAPGAFFLPILFNRRITDRVMPYPQRYLPV